jgi:hypothetical protein
MQFAGMGAHTQVPGTMNEMELMFDIFATLPDGSPLWLEAVEGLDQARERLNIFVRSRPGAYFIYSEKTGGVVERTPCDSDTVPFQKTHRN